MTNQLITNTDTKTHLLSNLNRPGKDASMNLNKRFAITVYLHTSMQTSHVDENVPKNTQQRLSQETKTHNFPKNHIFPKNHTHLSQKTHTFPQKHTHQVNKTPIIGFDNLLTHFLYLIFCYTFFFNLISTLKRKIH